MITVTFGDTHDISWNLTGTGVIDLTTADSVLLYATDTVSGQVTSLACTYTATTVTHTLTGTLPLGRYDITIVIVKDDQQTTVPTEGLERLLVRGPINNFITQVRVLIPDTDGALFNDDEILTYLDLADDDPYEAAASAIDALVTKMTFTGYTGTVRTDDLSIQSNIDALLVRASELRARSLDNSFVIIDPPCRPRHVEAVPWW